MGARFLYDSLGGNLPPCLFDDGAGFGPGDVVENDNSLQDLLAGQGRIAVARLDGAPSDIRKDRISDKPVWYSFNLWACLFRESILCSVNRHAARGAEFSALRAVYA